MKTRILTSALIVAIAIPVFLLSGTIVYPIALALLSVRSVFEMLRVLGCLKRRAVAIPSYVLAVGLAIGAYFCYGDGKDFFRLCAICVYSYMLYLFLVTVVSKGAIKFSQIARAFCAISYVTLAFGALTLSRYIEHGRYYFLIPLICSWVSDVFAFIVGYFFGKHKLIPEISPKKTIEGSVGGIVFATVAMLIYGFLIDTFADGISVNYILLLAMGLVLSILSQAGDLIASTIKREEGVKDYGSILPGHGGITDRFDSVYAIALIALIVCVMIPPFA